MKIGKVTLGASVLALSLLALGCKKKEPNVEPVADTETQTAIDAAWATYVVTDIDQICAFMGEDEFNSHFYIPRTNNNNYQVVRDTAAKQKALTWRNGPVLCLDGRSREGSIFTYYKKDLISNPDANANSRYYRDFGYVANIAFQDYKVDGWEINLFDPGARAYIYNKLTTDRYDPKTERLTWLIAGKLLFKHPSDPAKNIVWEGKLYKELVNTNDKDIFNPNKQVAINWVFTPTDPKLAKKAAIIHYYGEISGSTGTDKPFKMTISKVTPLKRDFLCTSDPIASVSAITPGTVVNYVPNKEEHHPFIFGIASFTTGTTAQNIYPRQIYFGNEGEGPDADPNNSPCDNTGVVLIKGNSYPVNFRK